MQGIGQSEAGAALVSQRAPGQPLRCRRPPTFQVFFAALPGCTVLHACTRAYDAIYSFVIVLGELPGFIE